MKKYNINYACGPLAVLIWLISFFPGMAQAVVTCSAGTGTYAPQTLTVNISPGNAYVGNELPVGKTIYRNAIKTVGSPGVYCDGAATLTNYWTVSNEPLGAATSMSGLAYSTGSGPVYPTNVTGVGVLFFSSKIFSSSVQSPRSDMVLKNAGNVGYANEGVDIALIKTGPIASGSVVNATSFPNMALRIPAQSGYAGLPLRPIVINFTGSVQFITATCTTPDVDVNMGDNDLLTYFTQAGSAGPWVDSSISLENCPTFAGYHADHGTAQTSSGSATASGTSRNANIFTVSLTPANSVTDGVIALDDVTNAATGIGLQIGYTPNDLTASATSPTTLWKPGVSWDITAPTDGRKEITLPLAARYYQNAGTATPGVANAKVIFNIDYK